MTKKEQNPLLEDNPCIECENDTMLKYADLATQLDVEREYIRLLEKQIDVNIEIMKFQHDKIKDLENKLRIYIKSDRDTKGVIW